MYNSYHMTTAFFFFLNFWVKKNQGEKKYKNCKDLAHGQYSLIVMSIRCKVRLWNPDGTV